MVVPESGVAHEPQLLFNFAMRVADRLPDHRFIFRSHPVKPFAQVLPDLERDPRRYPNIEITDHSFGMDLKRSSVVLYRGSSSVLYAIPHGLKPLYLHHDRHPHVDPLFALNGWRSHVATPHDAADVLQRYAQSPKEKEIDEWRRAVEYVDAYTMPVTEESIGRFLEAVGLAHQDAVPCTV
jgi:hypothetical protein